MKFKESKLAHKYCQGKGIELGGAAHNPFNLKECLNISPKSDENFFKKSQIDLCGEFLKIDLYGTAEKIPIKKNSMDYIISSHVIEHVPDVISAFLEWNRILKGNGIIFMIFPKKNALKSDIGRSLSQIKDFEYAFLNKEQLKKININNHIWVFSLNSMLNLIDFCNKKYNLNWGILEALETDDKVGNGHCLICKKK